MSQQTSRGQRTDVVVEVPNVPTGRVDGPEKSAQRVVIIAMVAFGVYGFVTGASSTVGYMITVVVLAVIIRLFRGVAVPRALAFGLAALAVLHLAGGLIRVGDDVLYNASVVSSALRYDHLVHAYGSLVGTLALWTLLVPAGADGRRRMPLAMVVLSGLGLGAVNETVEFLTTVAHHGGHVGGYTNTGWDLVSNVVGAGAAGLIIARERRHGDPVSVPHAV